MEGTEKTKEEKAQDVAEGEKRMRLTKWRAELKEEPLFASRPLCEVIAGIRGPRAL